MSDQPTPTPRSTPPHRIKHEGAVNDPLVPFQGKPVISIGGPHQKYIGRVILELWESGTQINDVNGLAVSSDAADGKHDKLLARVAAAFPQRVARDAKPGPSTSS